MSTEIDANKRVKLMELRLFITLNKSLCTSMMISKAAPVSEGHQVVDLLFAPALLLQCVTDDVRRPLEARIKMKGHVCPRLHAAPAGQVNLKSTRYHCLSLSGPAADKLQM